MAFDRRMFFLYSNGIVLQFPLCIPVSSAENILTALPFDVIIKERIYISCTVSPGNGRREGNHDRFRTIDRYDVYPRTDRLFGGAGMPTESGIPDFRGANGLYRQKTDLPWTPEEMLSHHFYREHTAEFFTSYKNWAEAMEQAEPNRAHYALSELE